MSCSDWTAQDSHAKPLICSKIITTIAAAAKKSNTNKDTKTVCMVGCLYSLGARGNKKETQDSP